MEHKAYYYAFNIESEINVIILYSIVSLVGKKEFRNEHEKIFNNMNEIMTI